MIHCGQFIKCNNAEGCQGCEYEGEEDYRCAYCGEDKRENQWKHMAEIDKFLQIKIQECKDMLDKAVVDTKDTHNDK